MSSKDIIIGERNNSIEVLKNKSDTLEASQQALKADLAKQVVALRDAERINHTIIDENVSLQENLQTLTQKYNELIKQMTKESELTTKTLEKAISSSVRLCVVAPTVNVHIADKKLKMQSK